MTSMKQNKTLKNKQTIGPLKYPSVTLQDVNSGFSTNELFNNIYNFYVPIDMISFSNENVVNRSIWVSDDEQYSSNSDIVTIIIHSSRYLPKKTVNDESKPLGAFISFQFRNHMPPKYFMRRKNGIRSRYSSKQIGFSVKIQDFELVYKTSKVPTAFVSLKKYTTKPRIRRKRSWKSSSSPISSSKNSVRKANSLENSQHKRKKFVKKTNSKDRATVKDKVKINNKQTPSISKETTSISKETTSRGEQQMPKIAQSPSLMDTSRNYYQTSSPVVNEFVSIDNTSSPQTQLMKDQFEETLISSNVNQKQSLRDFQFLLKESTNQDHFEFEFEHINTTSSSLSLDEILCSVPYNVHTSENEPIFDFDFNFDESIQDFKLSLENFMGEQPVNLETYSLPKSTSNFSFF
ncbi:hypothetical protein M0813_15799 [Anaeramoeba flamelloides]|uniref:Uncharacterized protein n=1 Tax=Anaeramoeba flamelloides TaxID=1746091 RepID=A0ABQ8Z2R9_9EUKA|nr:hypothetical protein M0813_15799 [Anaeramoeba flamelloides]